MNRDELRRSWAVTRGHLEDAMVAMDLNCPEATEAAKACHDWLEDNELEMAFGELESHGFECGASQRFWSSMLAAALNMKLNEHATRCKRKVESFFS